ncbi:hypothetical protein EDD37DRAFT_9714 [Exophiala viscosa]|uniref:Uncharacterized protein n=1 Tax=Exophiala viscosa TaxID=2486360 RepID=A0AAN6I7X3_9EURO|nr:hypothetical protein EDD36DRAFT_111096 [Exophiala viscosa]KAI1628480.1 hypothetical protein EDD37DRAFT_9714 [Exophiala viscosa]
MKGILALLLSILMFLVTKSNAVRGDQRPNTVIGVFKPTISCHCELVNRTVNVMPEQCFDYCIWRWAWYWF